ncbi:MAG: hypothetical protein IPP46_14980 [Bacteroidetes bacterium]|nr:hypothetical protein [Bacteroidota bacterium]
MTIDKSGLIWVGSIGGVSHFDGKNTTDGNGIFKHKSGEFIHLTSKNGLTDNNIADILEDKQGNIWIGTFNGGVSKYDGKTY